MDCPLRTPDGRDVVLDFCGESLNASTAVSLERHAETCPACSRFFREQRTVNEALELWAAAPVSDDFNRRLYQRIEQKPARWATLVRWLPAAAAACLLITAGILIQRPGTIATKADTAVVDVQPDQVEAALDAMDTLSEFSRNLRIE